MLLQGLTSEMTKLDVPFHFGAIHFYPLHRTVLVACCVLGSLRGLSTFVSEDIIVSKRTISFK